MEAKDIARPFPGSLGTSVGAGWRETINGEGTAPEDGARNTAARWTESGGPTAIAGLEPPEREVWYVTGTSAARLDTVGSELSRACTAAPRPDVSVPAIHGSATTAGPIAISGIARPGEVSATVELIGTSATTGPLGTSCAGVSTSDVGCAERTVKSGASTGVDATDSNNASRWAGGSTRSIGNSTRWTGGSTRCIGDSTRCIGDSTRCIGNSWRSDIASVASPAWVSRLETVSECRAGEFDPGLPSGDGKRCTVGGVTRASGGAGVDTSGLDAGVGA